MEIPGAFMRVLASGNARQLLLLLAESSKPIRYSEARRHLGLRPSEFQRALLLIEDTGLVLARAPAEHPTTARPERPQVVHLEATRLGRFLAGYYTEMSARFQARARQAHVTEAVEAFQAES